MCSLLFLQKHKNHEHVFLIWCIKHTISHHWFSWVLTRDVWKPYAKIQLSKCMPGPLVWSDFIKNPFNISHFYQHMHDQKIKAPAIVFHEFEKTSFDIFVTLFMLILGKNVQSSSASSSSTSSSSTSSSSPSSSSTSSSSSSPSSSSSSLSLPWAGCSCHQTSHLDSLRKIVFTEARLALDSSLPHWLRFSEARLLTDSNPTDSSIA